MLIFCDERIGRKDIAASADRIQSMIDGVIKVAMNYLNTGEGVDMVQSRLEDVHARAQELFVVLQSTGQAGDVPLGIHPADWEWIEKLKSEGKGM
jgi:hypothetical protein